MCNDLRDHNNFFGLFLWELILICNNVRYQNLLFLSLCFYENWYWFQVTKGNLIFSFSFSLSPGKPTSRPPPTASHFCSASWPGRTGIRSCTIVWWRPPSALRGKTTGRRTAATSLAPSSFSAPSMSSSPTSSSTCLWVSACDWVVKNWSYTNPHF